MILEKENQFSSWLYNVQDHFKGLSTEQINAQLAQDRLPCAVLMTQIQGDFNFGAVIRSCNAFNVSRIFYYGKRHYDRRSTCGTHHYVNLSYLATSEELKMLKEQYHFVALENNIDRHCHNLKNYAWYTDSLIVIGEEGSGIPDNILELCDDFVSIPMRGSVRSFNAANAAGIALYDYYVKSNLE